MDAHLDPDTTLQSPARKPRNWEVLKALESLSPPSPSPSFGSDFLATLASSGEIPIFLDSGDSDAAADALGFSPTSRRLPTSSISTGTMGTFGMRHHVLDAQDAKDARLSGRDSFSTNTRDQNYITPTNSSQYLSPRAERTRYHYRMSSGTSRFNLSTYRSPKKKKTSDSGSLPGSPRSTSNSPAWTTPSQSSDTLNLPDTCRRSPSIGASLSTIVFAAGSAASPAVSASLVTEAQLYASRHRQPTGSATPTSVGPVDFPASTFRSPELGHSRTPTFRPVISQPSSPLSGTVLTRGGPRIRTRSTATTSSTESAHSGRSARSARSNRSSRSNVSVLIGPPVSSPAELNATTPGLPPVLSWMQNVRLELWIDQEGFRLVRPVFKLSGYRTPSQLQDVSLVDALTNGSAEFCPAETQTFVFHHGALDPQPVLRKLTLAGDDSRDYLSRQASLVIKENGIYSVSGTDSFDSNATATHLVSLRQPLKLNWRFEYRVDDSAVKPRAGEKMLTPISFSCSPGLLHPTHGKKVKVIQVVKKGLTPKLTSEKLEVPSPDIRVRMHTEPLGETLRARPSSHGEEDARVPGVDLISRHRRVQSTSAQPLIPKEDHDGNRSGAKKARTASLTAEWRNGRRGALLERQLVVGDTLVASLATNAWGVSGRASPSRRLSRHILPPAQLSDMLDEKPSPVQADLVDPVYLPLYDNKRA